MVSLTTLVILASVCVAINAEPRLLKQACMKIRKGFTAGYKGHIRPVVLPQGQVDWETPLPVCHGETAEPVGLDVMACDDDQIPELKFIEPASVSVHRTGSKDSYVVIQITLYCKTPQTPLTGKIPQSM